MDIQSLPLAIVDVETTGTRPALDRVTEIAVIQIDDWRVRSRWSTLVNPGTALPADIQALTGITREMLAGAPRFAELAGELHDRLAGRLFIAHNARFDHGFLRREFLRAGMRFAARTLCSVRLSRRLYPGGAHDLDSVIARHGIDCRARHRAAGDAEALWDFLQLAAAEHGGEVLGVAARLAARVPSLPPQLDPAQIDEIPDAPGVYLFYGENGAALYVGKSRALRSRVQQHFSSLAPWTQAVRRIEWRRTAGELGALLLGSRLVKELAPAHNRAPRQPHALAGLRNADWPYRGPLGVVETDPGRDATEIHVVDRWCYLGAARDDAELAELLEAPRRPAFDYDHYRIFASHLARRGVRVVELAR